MNEKGLVANLLFLTESSYYRPDDNRPVMGISIWTQYVLDNFATVEEAVAGLKDDTFRIDAPDLPNGAKSTLHLSVSDATGNSAIFDNAGHHATDGIAFALYLEDKLFHFVHIVEHKHILLRIQVVVGVPLGRHTGHQSHTMFFCKPS